MTSWPESWHRLEAELRRSRSTLAVISGEQPYVAALCDSLRAVADDVVSLGEQFAACESVEEVPTIFDLDGGSTLLLDIEVLFTPALTLNVMAVLRQMARGRALVVRWPSRIRSGRLSYSAPGRLDYFDEPARDVIVLRPNAAPFPDEVPYTVERYPA